MRRGCDIEVATDELRQAMARCGRSQRELAARLRKAGVQCSDSLARAWADPRREETMSARVRVALRRADPALLRELHEVEAANLKAPAAVGCPMSLSMRAAAIEGEARAKLADAMQDGRIDESERKELLPLLAKAARKWLQQAALIGASK